MDTPKVDTPNDVVNSTTTVEIPAAQVLTDYWKIDNKLQHMDDKMDRKFERIFKELSHLRGKVYAGAGAISIIVTLVVSKLKGWI